MEYTQRYDSIEQRRTLLAEVKRQGHELVHDDHLVSGVSTAGTLTLENSPDTTPMAVPFALTTQSYQAAGTDAARLAIIAQHLGLVVE